MGKPLQPKRKERNLRAERAIAGMVEKGRNQRTALREAGYSQAYADQPGKFRATKAGQELIKRIEAEIKALWVQANKTRRKAEYRDCIRAIDTLQKLGRLEKGEPTEISKVANLENYLQEFFK